MLLETLMEFQYWRWKWNHLKRSPGGSQVSMCACVCVHVSVRVCACSYSTVKKNVYLLCKVCIVNYKFCVCVWIQERICQTTLTMASMKTRGRLTVKNRRSSAWVWRSPLSALWRARSLWVTRGSPVLVRLFFAFHHLVCLPSIIRLLLSSWKYF